MSKKIVYTGPSGFNSRLGRAVKQGEDITGSNPRTLVDMVSLGVAKEIKVDKPKKEPKGS